MLRGLNALRHIVKIVSPSLSLDSRGQRTGSDTDILDNVPAAIKPLSGRELEKAHQLYPNASASIEFYSDPSIAITTTMAIVEKHTSKRFEIGYVQDVLRNGERLTCLVSEVL